MDQESQLKKSQNQPNKIFQYMKKSVLACFQANTITDTLGAIFASFILFICMNLYLISKACTYTGIYILNFAIAFYEKPFLPFKDDNEKRS